MVKHEIINHLNLNNLYVKQFLETATKEQLSFFDIAAKLLSNNPNMDIILDYTDDIHLMRITKKLVEYKNSAFAKQLQIIQYKENLIQLKTIIPDNEVFKTYIMSVIETFEREVTVLSDGK